MLHKLDENTDWKQKYQATLGNLQARESEWARIEELLRHAISRLTTAGRGFDSRLDKVLREIQEISREKRDEKLSAALKTLTIVVEALEKPAQENKQRRSDPIILMLELLQNIHFDATQRDQLKKICSELLISVANGRDRGSLSVYIQDLSALINENFDNVDADAKAAQIVRQLLELLALDEVSAGHIRDRVGEIRKFQQDELQALADMLNEKLGAAGGSLPIDSVMSTLLDRLAVVTGENNANREIQARIEDGIDVEDWPVALNSIVNSVAASLRKIEKEKRELEAFIVGVTEQLGDITSIIAADQSDNRNNDTDTRSLHRFVTEGISLMQNTSASARDLGELKHSIGESVDAIRGGVDDFVERINKRHQESEARNQQLSEQLEQMEQETQELQVMLSENRTKLMYDSLTGVYSRMAYDERILEELARWDRYQSPFAYVILDLDHFKRINDTYGHSAGDKALKLVAQLMQNNLRQSDYLFRIGGEEFVILLPNTDESDADAVVTKMRAAIAECQFHFKGDPVHLTVSAGITRTRPGDRQDSLFERADKALYEAKHAGRNRQVVAGA